MKYKKKGSLLMNNIKTLLINRIDHCDQSDEVKSIFFTVKNIGIPMIENKIIDIVQSIENVQVDDMVLKYNGFEIGTPTKNIPLIIKELSRNDIDIYSVYEVYDPYE